MKSDVSALTYKERKPAKKLSHLEVHPAKNGGHTVKHIFTHYEHPSEEHVFGEGEGQKMLAHVGKMVGVEHGESAGSEEPQEEKENAEV